MYKKNILLLMIFGLLLTSCGGAWDSVKRGLTGEKRKSADEFLVEKKDPLILPPDYENLPTPDDRTLAKEEISSFKKTLEQTSIEEDISPSTAGSAEESILREIRKK